MMTALIYHDANWEEVKYYQKVKDIKHTLSKRVKSDNNPYSKLSFISY